MRPIINKDEFPKITIMSVKIRLQRFGRKGKPFYHIVVADARARRDGRCIDKLGSYNPNTDPATVELKVDSAVEWLQKGAQPTDTARTLLSRKGVMLKKHLLGGVSKGAFDLEEAEKRFQAWLDNKEKSEADKIESISKSQEEKKALRLEEEKKYREAKLAEAEPVEEEAEVEEPTEEAPTEQAEGADAQEETKAEE